MFTGTENNLHMTLTRNMAAVVCVYIFSSSFPAPAPHCIPNYDNFSASVCMYDHDLSEVDALDFVYQVQQQSTFL